ncbi:MAG TPA: TPM domain-containing protein [Chitinophagaceae bacterium]|nr:TPM domain-containing protein [Chitinophagaceae bacterium]
MKNNHLLLLFMLTLFSIMAKAGHQDNTMATSEKLSDQAGLYTPQQQQSLLKIIAAIEKSTRYKLRIYTIDTIDENSASSDSLTRSLFKQWFPTPEDVAWGISIVLGRKNKMPYVMYGDKAKLIFTRQESKYINFVTFYANWKQKEYYKGTMQGLAKMLFLIHQYDRMDDADLWDASSHLKIDHIFLLVKDRQASIQLLQQYGFEIDTTVNHTHTGQGTIGSYVFFRNFYIELLSVDDAVVAQQGKELHQIDYAHRQDWAQNSSCHMGIGLSQLPFDSVKIPFATSRYHAEWMKAAGSLNAALSNTDTKQPVVFVLSPSLRSNLDMTEASFDKLLNEKPLQAKKYRHNSDINQLTGMEIHTDVLSDKATMKAIDNCQHVAWKEDGQQLIILEFDNHRQGKEIDLSKELSLRIEY